MSSKKTTSKAPAKVSASEKKSAKPAPAKKAAPAKAAPAKAAAPAKKAAPAKAAPAKKPAAKPAPAKKTAPAKAAPAKAAPAKKPVVKKEAPAKKEPAKAVKAAPAKAPAAKPAPAKAEVSKKPAPAKKVEPAVVAAPAKEAKAPAKAPAPQPKPVEKEVVKEPVKEPVKETVKEVPEVKVSVNEKAVEKKAAVKSDYPYSVLLDGKKPCKFIMFVEIDEQEERANKKKVTSEMKNLEKKPTSAIRHKISLAEETQEELTERILKELEEQNAAFTREAATQICTRCNKNLVSPEFWVDKHLGYCEECAAILHLGQSKEARKVEYQLGAMGGDSLDEADDDEFEGPDAADLKEAEEELADFDD